MDEKIKTITDKNTNINDLTKLSDLTKLTNLNSIEPPTNTSATKLVTQPASSVPLNIPTNNIAPNILEKQKYTEPQSGLHIKPFTKTADSSTTTTPVSSITQNSTKADSSTTSSLAPSTTTPVSSITQNSKKNSKTADSSTTSSLAPSTILGSIKKTETDPTISIDSVPQVSPDKDSSPQPEMPKINLKEEYKKLNCDNEQYYSKECNKFLLKKEIVELNYAAENPDENSSLYPTLNDANFNIKIASKKEFFDTKYDGEIYKNIKERADMLANADFELQPHQAFVKNFMSFQTPYSSMLLYHGLGTGKTCSAIGVCEEMRDYMKQTNITKRIIIVASENVQDNFKLQLFDERKLKNINGIWNIRSCTGNKILKEINPMNMKGFTKEKVVSQIKTLINTNYIFLGYVQFANYIIKTMNFDEELKKQRYEKTETAKATRKKINPYASEKIELNARIMKRLQKEFNNRLIVIDEIHNIRKTDDNENKKVAVNLELLVKSAQNMRFMFLSATPMYNNYKEIIWLLNIMNMNDRRGRIEVKDVFDKMGNFKKGGEALIMQKATGYVSFVRGENPYTFPYRVYPNEFAKDRTFPKIKYPEYQMNLKKIKHEDKKRILGLYLVSLKECKNCGVCQRCAYKYIMHHLRNKNFEIVTKKGDIRKMPSFENMESFGYTMLQVPLESLIISYPMDGLSEILDNLPQEEKSDDFTPSFADSLKESDEDDEDDGKDDEITDILEDAGEEGQEGEEEIVDDKLGGANTPQNNMVGFDPKQLTGKTGLERMMNFTDTKSNNPLKGEFEYKPTTLKKYGKIFSREEVGKYSAKIKSILDNIVNPDNETVSDGIILIYSQYIDSGLIPMALALEELGLTRYGQKGATSLFKTAPTDVVDVRTMKPPTDKNDFMPARYSMITGDTRISPDNVFEVNGLTGEDNKNGHKIKVVLISKAGAEGIDFKFIRQIHILDPWYNMNRIEQIIGRGVRNFSHKDLPFEKRNVQIFMYGTIIGDNQEESADLYVYRVAEFKALQIGKVTRVLKETAVDCIINHEQTNFTQKIMSEKVDVPITQELSTGELLKNFKIGDAPFSPACDYMAECNFNCVPNKNINENELNEDTYDEHFIIMNSEKIVQRIRMLFKDGFFYKKEALLRSIRTPKEYPYVQIFSALTQLIDDENEFIMDKYGRNGRLVNIGEYYLFQPIELRDKHASIYDRSVPIDYKHKMIDIVVTPNIEKTRLEVVYDKKDGVDEVAFLKGKQMVDEMEMKLELCKEYQQKKNVERGDDNWYKHSGFIIKTMLIDYKDKVTEEMLFGFVVAHIIETLLFEDKLLVMNYLYSLEDLKEGSFEWSLKEYFLLNSIIVKKDTFYFMYKLNQSIIVRLNKDNVWTKEQPEEIRELILKLNKMVTDAKKQKSFNENTLKIEDLLLFNKGNTKYNDTVGFIGYEKSNRYLVFKTKDMTSNRDTGARCDEAIKNKNIIKTNKILEEDKYTKDNTKMIKDGNNIIQEPVSNKGLCIIQEFVLRWFDLTKKNDKRWFLTPEMAIYHKLYKMNK